MIFGRMYSYSVTIAIPEMIFVQIYSHGIYFNGRKKRAVPNILKHLSFSEASDYIRVIILFIQTL